MWESDSGESIYQDLCHTGSPAGLSYLPEQGSLSEDCKAASGMELIGICPDGRMRCSKRNGIYQGKQKTHKRAAEYSDKKLTSLGFRVYPSRADYILFYTELPLYELLLKKQILIRNCENYRGLSKGYYRIAVRGQAENERLISALREVMGK